MGSVGILFTFCGSPTSTGRPLSVLSLGCVGSGPCLDLWPLPVASVCLLPGPMTATSAPVNSWAEMPTPFCYVTLEPSSLLGELVKDYFFKSQLWVLVVRSCKRLLALPGRGPQEASSGRHNSICLRMGTHTGVRTQGI